MSPRISSPAHPSSAGSSSPAGRGGRGAGRGGMTRFDRALIGQTVRVTQGPYKGEELGYLIWTK